MSDSTAALDSPTSPRADGAVFPSGFLWGAATSSYQIEGAVEADGRVPSIWDTFSHSKGRTRHGDTGDVATDHYHLYREDVALMAELGIRAYRFSIAWPRVMSARGAVNQRGLDFYRNLVDSLLEAGIEPVVNLYHWDHPQWLEDSGGWRVRDSVDAFVEFTRAVRAALGDRVNRWITLNEPWCSAMLGHVDGVHAPGYRDPAAGVAAAHHLLLAHGAAARELTGPGHSVGLTLNLTPILPATEAEDDVRAARLIDGLQNRMYLDPALLGRYPDDVLEHLETVSDLAFMKPGDGEAIRADIGWLGVNYYTTHRVAARSEGTAGASPWPGVNDVAFLDPSSPTTAMGWGIDSASLTDLLGRLKREYAPIPLIITENGAAFDDEITEDDRVLDESRVEFLDAHLRAAHRAIQQGVDLRGYFVWSLLDNFEWAEGYSKRFGIVRVDYETQQRTPKSSARWYSDVISRNGIGAEASKPASDREA